MRNPLLAPDLREFVAERDEEGLRDFFSGHHPLDAAELLDDLEPEEVRFVLGLLAGRSRAAIFDYLDKPLQEGVAALMDDHDLAAFHPPGEFGQAFAHSRFFARLDLVEVFRHADDLAHRVARRDEAANAVVERG